MRPPRTYIRHEQPRPNNSDGLQSIYCRTCGREVGRYSKSMIRSITKCAICIAKENGIQNPEDHILHQYNLSTDTNKLPVPIDDDGLESGILMLYPEEQLDMTGILPATGGVFGTVKSIFKAFGFKKTKDEVKEEEPISRSIARKKRGKGLYGEE